MKKLFTIICLFIVLTLTSNLYAINRPVLSNKEVEKNVNVYIKALTSKDIVTLNKLNPEIKNSCVYLANNLLSSDKADFIASCISEEYNQYFSNSINGVIVSPITELNIDKWKILEIKNIWRPRFSWTRDCVKYSDQGERIWKRMEAALVQRRESVARPELHQKSNVGVPTARKKQYFVSCGVNLSMP